MERSRAIRSVRRREQRVELPPMDDRLGGRVGTSPLKYLCMHACRVPTSRRIQLGKRLDCGLAADLPRTDVQLLPRPDRRVCIRSTADGAAVRMSVRYTDHDALFAPHMRVVPDSGTAGIYGPYQDVSRPLYGRLTAPRTSILNIACTWLTACPQVEQIYSQIPGARLVNDGTS